MFGATFKAAKEGFFDSEKVLRAITQQERQVLSKMGAFVRRTARTSIKPAGKKNLSSPPGSPPRSHQGAIRLIFFSYEFATRSVVIGPVRDRGGVAKIIEEGGDETIMDPRTKKRRRVHYEARPFMGPAAAVNIPKFAEMWRDKVR